MSAAFFWFGVFCHCGLGSLFGSAASKAVLPRPAVSAFGRGPGLFFQGGLDANLKGVLAAPPHSPVQGELMI